MLPPGLPTPPTDNYHKFRALAGLWLILVSSGGFVVAYFLIMEQVFETKKRLAELKIDQRLMRTELENESAKNKLVRQKLLAVRADANDLDRRMSSDGDLTRAQVKQYRETFDAIERDIAELDLMMKARDTVHAELDVRNSILSKKVQAGAIEADHLRWLASALDSLKYLAVIAIGFGFCLAWFGFRDWRLLQGVQDAMSINSFLGETARCFNDDSTNAPTSPGHVKRVGNPESANESASTLKS